MNPYQRLLFLLVLTLLVGCGSKHPSPPPGPPWWGTVKSHVSLGEYDKALAVLQDQTSRVPLPAYAEEALFLEGYLQAHGRFDFRKARQPLQTLVDTQARHRLGASALRLLGDCYYLDSLYDPARRQYRALLELHGKQGQGAYALFQMGNCWAQQDDPGRALTSWREAVDQYPTDPWAVQAQWQVVNVYVSLDDPQMARPELEKLSKMSRDPDIAAAIELSLKRLEAASRAGRGK